VSEPPAPPTAPPDAEPQPVKTWIETVVVTGLVVLVGWLAHPDDPFFLRSPFPWIAVAPVMVALRHGFAPAMASVALLAALLAGAGARAPHAGAASAYPSELALGTLVLAMLCGQFSNVWRRRVARLDAEHAFLRDRFDAFSRVHRLLEFSHDRLERRLGASAFTLRDGVLAVAAELGGAADGAPPLAASAQKVLDLFGVYGSLDIASLHAVEDGALVGAPLGALGDAPPVSPDDGLVVTALRTKRVAFVPGGVDPEGAAGRRATALVCAVPLADMNGRAHAVVAIHAMPFLAFHEANLQLLAVLGGHVADVLAFGAGAGDATPLHLSDFERRLRRALLDLRERAACAVARIVVPRAAPASEVLDALFVKELRGGDCPLVVRDADGNATILALLPFTDAAGAAALRARLEAACAERLGLTLEAAGASIAIQELQPGDSVAEVMHDVDIPAPARRVAPSSGSFASV